MKEKEVIWRIHMEINTLLQKQKLSPCSFACLSQARDLLDILYFELGLDLDEQAESLS